MNTARLAELIKEIRIAMLSTIEPDGHVRSRPMATVERPGFDGVLWFFTDQSSSKIVEVQEDPRVNLSYCEPTKGRYVSVSGTCELVRDKEKAKQFWDPFFCPWFPKGMDDPDLALLKVTVEAAEYWDAPSGSMLRVTDFVKSMTRGQGDHCEGVAQNGAHEKIKIKSA